MPLTMQTDLAEPPNWWRKRILSEPMLKGRKEDWGMPLELQQQLDKVYGHHAVGAFGGASVSTPTPLSAIARIQMLVISM